MSWLTPLDDDAMNSDQKKAFDRALSKLDIEDPADAPRWLRVLANSPEFLKDTYMNLSRSVFKDDGLKAKTKLLLATVAASHWGEDDVAEFFADRAQEAGYTDEEIHEALGIAATTTSFNMYYKFRSLADTDAFEGLRPGLRGSLYMRPSLGEAFKELVSLVISTANGCKSCVSGHVNAAVKADVTKAQIDDAIRTGAIIASICQFT